MRERPPSRLATGISTGPDLQPPEDSTHLESPVRTSDGSDSDHLVPTNTNKTPKGSTAGGLTLEKRTDKGIKTGGKDRGEVVGTPTHLGLTLEKRTDKGIKTGGKDRGEVVRTPTHLGLTNPTDKTKTKTTNPIVQPQQAGGTKSPVPGGEKEKQKQVEQGVGNPVVRKLFKMPDDSGPQIRMPWFQGKPERG